MRRIWLGLNLTMLPFIVDSYEQGWKLYDESKWLKAEFDKAPQKGFRFLSTFEAGFRCMTTKGPLRTPDDAKGKKLRTFPNEMMRWTLDAIGFSVQIMPLPEVYMAIQQGAVWGQENPIDTIYSNKFYEVAPYVTLTNHVYSPIPLAISEKTWQKFSPADREAVTKAAKEAADWSRKTIQANDDNQLKEMASKGAKIINSFRWSHSGKRYSRCTARRVTSTAPPTSMRFWRMPRLCARLCPSNNPALFAHETGGPQPLPGRPSKRGSL